MYILRNAVVPSLLLVGEHYFIKIKNDTFDFTTGGIILNQIFIILPRRFISITDTAIFAASGIRNGITQLDSAAAMVVGFP